MFISFPEKCIIFIEGKQRANPKRKDGIKMKITDNDFVRIVKDQCESIVKVMEKHAEETTSKEEMKSYMNMATGKLRGVIDMAICMYACELANESEAYWTKIHEVREYERETDSKITDVFSEWYESYLESVVE